MTTMRDVWGHRDVASLMLSDRNYKLHPNYKMVNPDLIVGLELEIEGWDHPEEPQHRGFSFTSDGSLRGASVEAITKPTRSKFVPHLLESFFSHFEVSQKNYSERCSVHVHVNCQDLTKQQLRNVCLIYQAVERVLFSWIGEVREQNIFCIPWYQCNISSRFVYKFLSDTDSTVRRWQKYTALNLLPLREQGTIEFRHLEGTCDLHRITTWLNFIGSIFRCACSLTYKELRATIADMNSVSNYGAFIEQVFGEYAIELISLPSYRENLATGIVDCKLLLIDDNKVSEETVSAPVQADGIGNEIAGVRYDSAIVDEFDDLAIPAPAPAYETWGTVAAAQEAPPPTTTAQLLAQLDAMTARADPFAQAFRPAPIRPAPTAEAIERATARFEAAIRRNPQF